MVVKRVDCYSDVKKLRSRLFTVSLGKSRELGLFWPKPEFVNDVDNTEKRSAILPGILPAILPRSKSLALAFSIREIKDMLRSV